MSRYTRYRRTIALSAGLFLGFLGFVQLCPNILFGHAVEYRGFSIASDRPIDPAIRSVIDDARRRLSTSSIAKPDDRFRVFICNDPWRLRFFTQSSSIGAGTVYLTRNIFIRSANIASNSIYSPGSKPLLDRRQRTLAYYLAHEATHVVQLRRYGLIKMLRSPVWLVEGYADEVAKAGDFDPAENRALLRRHDYLLSENSGLYRRYQLMVETALGIEGATIDTLFANPPAQDRLLAEAVR